MFSEETTSSSHRDVSNPSYSKKVSLSEQISEQIRNGGLTAKPTSCPRQISSEQNALAGSSLENAKISVETFQPYKMSSSSNSPRMEVSSDEFSSSSKILPNQYVPFQQKGMVIREVEDNAEDELSNDHELPSRTQPFQHSQDYIEVEEEGEDGGYDEEDDVFEFLHWKQSLLQQVNWNRVPKLLDKQRARYETDMFAALCLANQTEIIRLMSVPVLMENGEEWFYSFEEAALYCFNWQRGLKLPLPGGLNLTLQDSTAQSDSSSKNMSPEPSPTASRSEIAHSGRNLCSQQTQCSNIDSFFVRNPREQSVSRRDFNQPSSVSEVSTDQELPHFSHADVNRSSSMERIGTSLHAQGSVELAASSFYFNAYEQFFSQLRVWQEKLHSSRNDHGDENISFGMTEEEVMRWILLLSEQEDVYGKNMFDILDDYRDHRVVQLKVRESALPFAVAVLKVFQEKFDLVEPLPPPIVHVTYVPGINSSGNATNSQLSVPSPSSRTSPATNGSSFHSSSQPSAVSVGSDMHSDAVITNTSNNANSTFYMPMSDSSTGGMQNFQRPMLSTSINNNLFEANNEMNLQPQGELTRPANSSMDSRMMSMMMSMHSTPPGAVEANVAMLQQQLQMQQQQLQQQLLQQQALLASMTMRNNSQRALPQMSQLPISGLNMNGVPKMNQPDYGMNGVMTPSQSLPPSQMMMPSAAGMGCNLPTMQGIPMMPSNSGFTTPAASLSHTSSHSDSFSRSSQSHADIYPMLSPQYPKQSSLHPQQCVPTLAQLDSPTMQQMLQQQQQLSYLQPLPSPQAHAHSRHHRSHSEPFGSRGDEYLVPPPPASGGSSRSRGHRRKTSGSSQELMTIMEGRHPPVQQLGTRKKSVYQMRRHSDMQLATAETISNASSATSRRGSISSVGSDGNLSGNGSSGGSQMGNSKLQRRASSHGHVR